MNMQAVAVDLLAGMEVAERVYVQEQKHDPLAWTVNTTTEAIYEAWNRDEIDITDVRELVSDLKAEGGEIGKRVAEKLQDYINTEVRNKELCPKCFKSLVYSYSLPDAYGYRETAAGCECGYEGEL